MSKKGGSLNNRVYNNRSSLGQASSNVGNTIVLTVIIVAILAVVLFLVYKYLNSYKVSGEKTKTFVPFIHDAKERRRFTSGSLPQSSQGNEYNYNVWVYISDYSYRNGEDKCILYKGPVSGNLDNTDDNTNNQGNPGVWLLKKNNTLRVQVGLETDYSLPYDNGNNVETFQNPEPANSVTGMSNNNTVSNDNSMPKSDECDIEHFPLQTWVNLNVSLTNNVVDVCLNGDLVKSCTLSGAPLINNSDLHVCAAGGFNGFISNLKVTNKALSSKKIRTLYKKGPTLKQGLLGTLSDFFSFN